MDVETFDRNYTARLNRQQAEAVHAVDGAVLLLAVPGSGKTTVLVTRLGYMLCCCGIPADQILTMTYTRAATREMRQRFTRLFGQECPLVPEFRTINGVSSRIIAYYTRTHGTGQAFPVKDRELAELVRDLYRELSGEYPVPSLVRELRRWITYVKNQMLDDSEISKLDTGFAKFPELYSRYNRVLRQQKWMDYDDQMVYAKKILELYPDVLTHFQDAFPYLCVDESQDTSRIQHAILHLLAQKSGNLFLVGDEDQSIYGFRAAYPDALLHFEQTYPGARVLLMEENYRSTPEILHLSNAFIQKNRNRRPKTIRPTRAAGANVHLITAEDRSVQYPWLWNVVTCSTGQTAILYRNHDSALPLIDLLERQGGAYRCREMDDTFFTHRLVTDIRDILAFAHDGNDAECFQRIYFKLGCGISKKAAEYACVQSRASGEPILQALLRFPELSRYVRDRVTDLIPLLPDILEDSAERGLKRIWRELRYQEYAEQQKLDTNKFEILCLLAARVSSPDALIARLDELQSLVAEPHISAEDAPVLSTIHASKGLEYDTVYLLDVLDGVLPAVTEPKSPEEHRQYEEERRLLYVAMTRAKDHLYLFSCRGRASGFLRELRANLPVERQETDDVFRALPANLCGEMYYHAQKGRGIICAACEGQCLIAYPDGETQFLTLGQMYQQRKIQWVAAIPAMGTAAGRTGKPGFPDAAARPGQKVRHKTFGQGEIIRFQPPFVTIRFRERGEKKFDLRPAVEKGLLYLDEEETAGSG